MKITQCPYCQGKLKVRKLECVKCGLKFEGEFYTPAIAMLSQTQQNFVELFVLNSGSLKEMARVLGLSYPTVRARLDEIIKDLSLEIKNRQETKKDN